MQQDSIVLIVCIISLAALGIVAAFCNITPDGLMIISRVIDILAVVLGASGYARLTRFMEGRRQKPKDD